MAIGTPVLLKELAVNSSGQASITLTLTTGAAVGDLVVVCLAYGRASNPSSFSVTDTGGNTWQLDRRDDKTTNNTPHTAIFSAILTTALAVSDTITIDPEGTVNYPIAAAYSVSGIAGSSWLDQAAGDQGVSSSPSSGSVTTGQADEILFGAVCSGSPQAFTAGSGWTELTDTGNTTKRLAVQYRIESATGTLTSDGTLAASADWTDSIVTYKADVPAGGRLARVLTAARARAAELRRRRGWALTRRAPLEAPAPPAGDITLESVIADAGIASGDTITTGTVSCQDGDLVLVAVDMRDETDTWTVAWTGGGAFTQLVDLDAARAQGGITVFYYRAAGTISDTITATSVGNTHPATISGSVWSGVDPADLGNYATAVTAGTDTLNCTGTITPETDGMVVVAFAGTRAADLTPAAGETMIEAGVAYGTGGDRVTLDHFRRDGTFDAAGGPVTVGATGNLDEVADWRLVMVALRPVAGGPAPGLPPAGGVLPVLQAVARASRW